MSYEKKLKELRLLKNVKLETDYIQLGKALEELGKVAQKINKTIEDTKVDMLGMFCYQGPPTKHWIETEGQFWKGWNECCNKILEKLEGLLVEPSKEKPRTVCLSCGYDGDDIQGDNADLYEGYGCPKCHSPLVVIVEESKEKVKR